MNVFVYGSLMFPVIWQEVVHEWHAGAPATLGGWRRCALRGVDYPGAVPDSASSIDGWVWFDVDEADVARLDAFEGAEYRRDAVEVALDDGRRCAAQVYAFVDAARVSGPAWDPDAFERGHLEGFVRRHIGRRTR